MAKWKSAGNLMTNSPGEYERTRTSSLKFQSEQPPPSLGNSTDELFFPMAAQARENKKNKRASKAKLSKPTKKGRRDGEEEAGNVCRTSSLPAFLDDQGPFSVESADGNGTSNSSEPS